MDHATPSVIEIIRPLPYGGAQADVFLVRYALWSGEQAIGIRHKPSGGNRNDERASLDRFLKRVEFSHELGGHDSGVFPKASRHHLKDGGHWFVVEEFDTNLESHSVGRDFGWPRAAGLSIPALRALRLMHEREHLHRDVKPSNMLIRKRDHRVALADFGLVLTQGVDPRYTRSSDPVGSPAYLFRSATREDMARDLYAWFVSWFEVATGGLPKWGGNLVAFHDEIRRASPPAILTPLFEIWQECPLDARGSVAAIRRITKLVLTLFPEVAGCPFASPHLDYLLAPWTRN